MFQYRFEIFIKGLEIVLFLFSKQEVKILFYYYGSHRDACTIFVVFHSTSDSLKYMVMVQNVL
jgi:hypothetical protein